MYEIGESGNVAYTGILEGLNNIVERKLLFFLTLSL
jgi:hypothetical protein